MTQITPKEPDGHKELMDAAEEANLTDEQWAEENEALMDKITQNDAERIAGYLGIEKDDPRLHSGERCVGENVIGGGIYKDTFYPVIDWLQSDAGTVAMILKLTLDARNPQPFRDFSDKGQFYIKIFKKDYPLADSINSALIAAIKEVLKDE